jgi:hypothetical protein
MRAVGDEETAGTLGGESPSPDTLCISDHFLLATPFCRPTKMNCTDSRPFLVLLWSLRYIRSQGCRMQDNLSVTVPTPHRMQLNAFTDANVKFSGAPLQVQRWMTTEFAVVQVSAHGRLQPEFQTAGPTPGPGRVCPVDHNTPGASSDTTERKPGKCQICPTE